MDQLYISIRQCENGFTVYQDTGDGRHGYLGRSWVAKNATDLAALVRELAEKTKVQPVKTVATEVKK